MTRAVPSIPPDAPVATTWLHRGPPIGIHAWTCRKTNGRPGTDEAQSHHEIAFVLDGAFAYVGPRGRAIAEPNTAVLLRAGEPYATSHPLGCGDAGFSVVLSDDLLDDLTDGASPARGPLSVPVPPRAHLLLSALRRGAAAGPPSDAIEIEETLVDIVAHVREATSAGASRPAAAVSGAHERVAFVRAVLCAEYDRSQRLGDLARRAGLSRAQLCRLFRRETGLPLHRYLNRLRLRAALSTMASRRTDLSDLAFAVGFSSHSHFTAAFRREFGMTPSRFRTGDR